jgi:hypothetical protein
VPGYRMYRCDPAPGRERVLVLTVRGIVREVETPFGWRDEDLGTGNERPVRPGREASVSDSLDRDPQLVLGGGRADRIRTAHAFTFDLGLDGQELPLCEAKVLAQIRGNLERDDDRLTCRRTYRANPQRPQRARCRRIARDVSGF